MTQEVKLRRVQCNYQAENARFLLECDFSKQYANYYRRRLEKTRPFLEFNCRSKWGPSLPLYGLAELAALPQCDTVEDLGQLSPSSISPDIHDGTRGSFEFSKRMRRFSESSQKESSLPKTSTQKEKEDHKLSDLSTTFSPILGAQKLSKPLSTESPIAAEEQQQNHTSAECIIIGTIFKRMKLQPDVIEELSRGDFHVKCDRYLGHYTSQDDKLVLEDTDESISLAGNVNPEKFVTGIVVALLGVPINDGSQFFVHDICYAEPNRQILYEDMMSQSLAEVSAELPLKVSDTGPIYLMVLSGIGFHPDMGKNSALTRALQDLIDFIWGGSKYADDERSSRVSRILVVGDNLSESRLFPDEASSSHKDDLATKMKQSRQVRQYAGSIQAVKHMDDFFAQLSKTINVDIMPGPSDPSSHLMPQQPFHPCMFPKSCMFPTFNCTTNPHHAIYNDNVEILATSGQNIDIISKFSGISDPIEIMKCHLMWGNSAPSAPDNLYSIPYEDDDPHVIDFIPEIYVAGCQDSYRAEYYCYTEDEIDSSSEVKTETTTSGGGKNPKDDAPTTSQHPARRRSSNSSHSNGETTSSNRSTLLQTKKDCTLLVTVPKFCVTFSCVLINLKNLESHLLSFG